MSKKGIAGFVLGAAAVGAYVLIVRPRLLVWGISESEKRRSLPGDELIQEPLYETTRAITIMAPAAHVWEWLVQLGVGRGGFYTYDVLENSIGLDIHNADRIHPEWQELKVGDTVAISPVTPLRVEILEPDRALVLHITMSVLTAQVVDANNPSVPEFIDWTWAFVLDAVSPSATRLLVRVRANYKPDALRFAVPVVLEPIHFIMERGMLEGIKSRAEGDGA